MVDWLRGKSGWLAGSFGRKGVLVLLLCSSWLAGGWLVCLVVRRHAGQVLAGCAGCVVCVCGGLGLVWWVVFARCALLFVLVVIGIASSRR